MLQYENLLRDASGLQCQETKTILNTLIDNKIRVTTYGREYITLQYICMRLSPALTILVLAS